MTEWILDITEENLEHILDSSKKVEGRVPDMSKPEKCYQNIARGDILTFRVVDGLTQQVLGNENTSFKVAYNRKYDSVREYLNAEGLKRALPQVKDVSKGVELYHNFPGYKERISQVGIYAIGLGDKL